MNDNFENNNNTSDNMDLNKKDIKAIAAVAAIIGVVLIVRSSGILKALPGFKSSFDFEVKPASEVVVTEEVTTTPEETTTIETTTTPEETTTEVTTTTGGPIGHIILTVYNENGTTTEYDVKTLSTSRMTDVRKVAYNDVEIHEITENRITYTFTTIDGETMSICANETDVKIELF